MIDKQFIRKKVKTLDTGTTKDGQIQLPDEVYKTLARVLYPRIRDYYAQLQSEEDDRQPDDSGQDKQSPAHDT